MGEGQYPVLHHNPPDKGTRGLSSAAARAMLLEAACWATEPCDLTSLTHLYLYQLQVWDFVLISHVLRETVFPQIWHSIVFPV